MIFQTGYGCLHGHQSSPGRRSVSGTSCPCSLSGDPAGGLAVHGVPGRQVSSVHSAGKERLRLNRVGHVNNSHGVSAGVIEQYVLALGQHCEPLSTAGRGLVTQRDGGA